MTAADAVLCLVCLLVGYDLGRVVEAVRSRKHLAEIMRRDETLLQSQRELVTQVRELIDDFRSGTLH